MRNLCLRLRALCVRAVESRAFVPACLVLALALRVTWVLLVPSEPISDFRWYYDRGQALVAGQGYTANGCPTAFFPPGYPALLALVSLVAGPSLLAAKFASILLQLATLVIAYRLAARLFASEVVGRLTLGLLAIYPNHIGYSSLLASENLFIPLLLLGALLTYRLLERPWWWVPMAGVVWGAAALTRPQAAFVPLIFFALALAPAWRARLRRRWVYALVGLYACAGTMVGAWMVRNWHELGRPVITTTTGYNLYIGNNPDANGTFVWSPLVVRNLTLGTNELENDRLAGEEARRYMRTHPVQVLRLLPGKLAWLYGLDFDGADWNLTALRTLHPNVYAERPLLTGLLGWYLSFSQCFYAVVMFTLAGGLVVACCRRRGWPRELPVAGLLVILYFTMLYLVYYGMPRYHAPMMPWAFMYVAALLAWWAQGERTPAPVAVAAV